MSKLLITHGAWKQVEKFFKKLLHFLKNQKAIWSSLIWLLFIFKDVKKSYSEAIAEVYIFEFIFLLCLHIFSYEDKKY